MKYKHIYFDLDRTLWDFERNALETFKEIYIEYELDKIFRGFNFFFDSYTKNNDRLWKQYREGNLKKSILRNKRFALTLKDFGVKDDILAEKIGDAYVSRSPSKTHLFPYVHEALSYLERKYNLYIITNGFNEVQFSKLKNCNLDQYFNKVFTSENAGANKPNRIIFEKALKDVNAKKTESIMIGDDFDVDVLGAKRFGMDQVWFNTNGFEATEAITYEIHSLKELIDIL